MKLAIRWESKLWGLHGPKIINRKLLLFGPIFEDNSIQAPLFLITHQYVKSFSVFDLSLILLILLTIHLCVKVIGTKLEPQKYLVLEAFIVI